MSSGDIRIDMLGDDELLQVLNGLDEKINRKVLLKTARDVARITVIKQLKTEAPARTGGLKRSMGVITGKSKRWATVFAGPRMSHNASQAKTGNYSGWIGNVLEFSKGTRRYPKRGKSLAPFNFPDFYGSVGPIRKKTDFRAGLRSVFPQVESKYFDSLRRIFEREMKKGRKSGII